MAVIGDIANRRRLWTTLGCIDSKVIYWCNKYTIMHMEKENLGYNKHIRWNQYLLKFSSCPTVCNTIAGYVQCCQSWSPSTISLKSFVHLISAVFCQTSFTLSNTASCLINTVQSWCYLINLGLFVTMEHPKMIKKHLHIKLNKRQSHMK